MRSWMLLPLLALAACSEGEPAPKAEAEAPADKTMLAGQWETSSEVTRLTQHDSGAPEIDTPAGTTASFTSCLTEADRKKPAATLFAGAEAQCQYDNFYMSRGRMNATMKCRLPGVEGEVVASVEGSHDADSFEGTMTTSTQLAGTGDVTVDAKLTGRRIGDCPAAPAEATGQ